MKILLVLLLAFLALSTAERDNRGEQGHMRENRPPLEDRPEGEMTENILKFVSKALDEHTKSIEELIKFSVYNRKLPIKYIWT